MRVWSCRFNSAVPTQKCLSAKNSAKWAQLLNGPNEYYCPSLIRVGASRQFPDQQTHVQQPHMLGLVSDDTRTRVKHASNTMYALYSHTTKYTNFALPVPAIATYEYHPRRSLEPPNLRVRLCAQSPVALVGRIAFLIAHHDFCRGASVVCWSLSPRCDSGVLLRCATHNLILITKKNMLAQSRNSNLPMSSVLRCYLKIPRVPSLLLPVTSPRRSCCM